MMGKIVPETLLNPTFTSFETVTNIDFPCDLCYINHIQFVINGKYIRKYVANGQN